MNAVKLHRFGVVGQQTVGEQSFFETDEMFYRFSRLDSAERAGDRAEDTGLLAIQNFFRRRRILKQAAITSAFARQHRHGLALQANNAAVRKRNTEFNRGVVDQELGVKIVAAVDDKLVTGGDFGGEEI